MEKQPDVDWEKAGEAFWGQKRALPVKLVNGVFSFQLKITVAGVAADYNEKGGLLLRLSLEQLNQNKDVTARIAAKRTKSAMDEAESVSFDWSEKALINRDLRQKKWFAVEVTGVVSELTESNLTIKYVPKEGVTVSLGEHKVKKSPPLGSSILKVSKRVKDSNGETGRNATSDENPTSPRPGATQMISPPPQIDLSDPAPPPWTPSRTELISSSNSSFTLPGDLASLPPIDDSWLAEMCGSPISPLSKPSIASAPPVSSFRWRILGTLGGRILFDHRDLHCSINHKSQNAYVLCPEPVVECFGHGTAVGLRGCPGFTVYARIADNRDSRVLFRLPVTLQILSGSERFVYVISNASPGLCVRTIPDNISHITSTRRRLPQEIDFRQPLRSQHFPVEIEPAQDRLGEEVVSIRKLESSASFRLEASASCPLKFGVPGESWSYAVELECFDSAGSSVFGDERLNLLVQSATSRSPVMRVSF